MSVTIKVLSGGERTRLAICKLLFQDFNFLIMDEPTNHLDLNSKEILKEALIAYEGTMLLVSHDRDFLDGLSNKIWEIQDGKIKTHYFGVNEFLQRINFDENLKAVESKPKVEKSNLKLKSKEEQAAQKKIENQVKKYEKEIEELETAIKQKTEELNQTDFSNTEAFANINADLINIQNDLNKVMEKWEEAVLELDSNKV